MPKSAQEQRDEWDRKLRQACAKNLGIDPQLIDSAELMTDGGGHFEGINVTIKLHTGRGIIEWVESSLHPPDTPCRCGFPRKMHRTPKLRCPVRSGYWEPQLEPPEAGGEIHRALISVRISAAYGDWEEGEAALDETFRLWKLPHKL